MKIAVIYSSKTGNTKKIAQAIHQALPQDTQFHAIEKAPDPSEFDLIFMGYWVDKGTADGKAINYMKTITNQKVATFSTLGAYPDSDHGKTSLVNAVTCFGENCKVVDQYICQGAIDPKFIEWMEKLPKDHSHAPDEMRRKRWAEAASHPDQNDLDHAATFAKQVLAKFE